MALSGEEWVDRLVDDAPVVHAMAPGDDPPLGLWSTDRDCYLLLARHGGRDRVSLETGAGLSTILLAALGGVHVCVTPIRDELERIKTYCADRSIDLSRVQFHVGQSTSVLPTLALDLVADLVFIDGSHGYPEPVIDWFYASSHLRDQGLLVIDDIVLPAVAQLCGALDLDPRFALEQRTEKWAAYRRIGHGSLNQDHFEQPWFRLEQPTIMRRILRRGARAIRPPK